MPDIRCPHCGKVFQVNEADYESIASQVKNDEFERELTRRIHEKEEASRLDKEVALEKERSKATEERARLDQEILALKTELQNKNQDKENALLKEREVSQQQIAELRESLSKMQGQIKLVESNAEQAKEKALAESKAEIERLKSDIKLAEEKAKVNEASLKESHQLELKQKDEQIAYYKDLKRSMSTKMVGETLEQHCLIEFNRIRAVAYPNAFFDKDNDSSSGSKGDFIFRDMIDDVEYISIMFEMKNEMEETEAKHRNDDFFKKLDHDRNEKGCEYAVLVSTLEADSDFYNAGIVDVSYEYPKMFVVRPQCFLAIIGLLTKAAKESAAAKKQLVLMQKENIDVTNFEDKLEDFKVRFSDYYEKSNNKLTEAINHIDRTIASLQKVRDELSSSDRNLRLANDKLQDLSVKKLTRGNETMKALFEQSKKKED